MAASTLQTFGNVETSGPGFTFQGNVHGNVNFPPTSGQPNSCLVDLRYSDGQGTDPREDLARIRRHKGGLIRSSYDWIFKNASYGQWCDEPQLRLLWIKASPGKGKTMLLSGIIDDLVVDDASRVSYFFCQAADECLNDATNVLRGLLYMLVDQEPLLLRYVQRKYDSAGKHFMNGRNAREAFTQILVNILKDPLAKDLIFVIDALDECTKGLKDLLDVIHLAATSYPAKWIVSSRSWPRKIGEVLDATVEAVGICLELDSRLLSGPVQAYIQHNVRQLARRKGYSNDEKDHLERSLTSKAGDTFLWVALVCQDLDHTDPLDVSDVLDNAPAGLMSLYTRMLEQIKDSKEMRPERYRTLLAIVLTAYRPLHVAELGSILSCSFKVSDRDTKRLALNCGGFLTVKDDIIYIVHQSSKDFLLGDEWLFVKGVRQQHSSMFSWSLEVLSQKLKRDICGLEHPGVHVTEISPHEKTPLTPLAYLCNFWVDHFIEAHMSGTPRDNKDNLRRDLLVSFIRTQFLHWLEALSLLGAVGHGVRRMEKLRELSEERGWEQRGDAPLLYDAYRFVLGYMVIIETSPLQVYESALVFSPENSLIRRLYETEYPEWIKLRPKVDNDWNACLRTIDVKTGIMCVVFSADGRQMATFSDPDLLQIWDLESGTCLDMFSTFEHVENPILGSFDDLVLSADGRMLAASNFNDGSGFILIWHVAEDMYVVTEDFNGKLTSSMAFSTDGRQLASASQYDKVQIWNPNNGTRIHTLEGHTARVTSVAFSTLRDRMLASASKDGTAKVWDTSTGKCSRTLLHDEENVVFAMFLGSSRQGALASITSNFTVYIWDPSTGARLDLIRLRTMQCCDAFKPIAMSADGMQAAFFSYFSNTIMACGVHEGSTAKLLKGHGDMVVTVAFTPDSRQLVSGSYDDTVKIWDLSAANNTQAMDMDSEPRLLAFSSEKRWLAVASGDSTIILSADSGTCLYSRQTDVTFIASMKFLDGGQILKLEGACDRIKIWDMEKETCVDSSASATITLTLPSMPRPRSVIVGTTGQWLARIDMINGQCQIWNLVQDICTSTFYTWPAPMQSTRAVVSPDGKMLALAYDADIRNESLLPLRILDIATGVCLTTLESGFSSTERMWYDDPVISFTPDSQGVIFCSQDGDQAVLELWNPIANTCMQRFVGHEGRIISAIMSPDCQSLVSYDEQGTLRLWSVVTGACLSTYEVAFGIQDFLPEFFLGMSNSYKVYTPFGELDVGRLGTPSLASSSDASESYSYRIHVDLAWVMRNERKIMWLPTEFRPQKDQFYRVNIISEGSLISWSCGSDRFVVMHCATTSNDS